MRSYADRCRLPAAHGAKENAPPESMGAMPDACRERSLVSSILRGYGASDTCPVEETEEALPAPFPDNGIYPGKMSIGGSVPSASPSPAGGACSTTADVKPRVEILVDPPWFWMRDVTSPCYACPNSLPDACPKLAQKMFPPVSTNPVSFSWQVRFGVIVEDGVKENPRRAAKTHVIQKIENTFSFSTAPSAGYPFTPVYWEAFALDSSYQTDIDYWQFDLPDLSAGTWEKKGTLYLVDQLPAGMAVGNVTDAGDLPSTTTEPKGLGRVVATRRVAGRFDFTGTAKRHHIP